VVDKTTKVETDTFVGTFHGNLPQVANTHSQVTVVKQDFNNNTLPLVTGIPNMWEVSMGGSHITPPLGE
jgi:hypothetical protein